MLAPNTQAESSRLAHFKGAKGKMNTQHTYAADDTHDPATGVIVDAAYDGRRRHDALGSADAVLGLEEMQLKQNGAGDGAKNGSLL